MIEQLRLFFLYTHLILTLALFWTKVDIVQLSASKSDFEKVSEDFNVLIAIGVFCILIKAISYGLTYNRMSLSFVAHFLCDIIASFFVFWIILDGWTWESYMVILVLCW